MSNACCSSTEVAEVNQSSSGAPLGCWRENLLADIGSDIQAVARDFPRMMVFVNTGERHNYDVVTSPEVAANTSQDAVFINRLKRVKDTVLLMTELCGEETTFGKTFSEAWDCRAENNSVKQSSDIHSLMQESLLSSKMIEALEGGKWLVHSRTFILLLLTVQGIMFYPSQYLDSRIRTSWMSHMQDNGWTIHIYQSTTSSSGPACSIVVQHRQVTRHYVEKKEVRTVPRFELQYSCTFSVDPRLVGVSNDPCNCRKAVNDISFDLVDARLEVPRCSCFARLWQSRARELQNKVEAFGIAVVPCKSL